MKYTCFNGHAANSEGLCSVAECPYYVGKRHDGIGRVSLFTKVAFSISAVLTLLSIVFFGVCFSVQFWIGCLILLFPIVIAGWLVGSLSRDMQDQRNGRTL